MDLIAQVLRAVEERPVNATEFERCAGALLQTRYPGLSAVEGGHDFGRDGDIHFPTDDPDPDTRGRMLATIALQLVAEAGQAQQARLRDEAKDRERQARIRSG